MPGGADERLRSVSFDTRAFALEERRGRVLDYFWGACEVYEVTESGQPFFMASDAWRFDDLLAMHNRWGANIQRQLSTSPSETLKLRLVKQGAFHRVDDGQVQTLGSASVHLSSMASGFADGPLERQCISVPFDRVGFDPRRFPASMSVPIDTAFGAILQSSVSTVFTQLPTCRASEAKDLAEPIVGLIKLMLHGRRSEEAGRIAYARARETAVRDYIDANLHDPAIGVETICRRFNCSRSALYRMFQAEGGVRRHLYASRLERAFRLLSKTAPVRGAVTTVAERCGYPDSNHFSRHFKTRFGVSPGSVVGLDHLALPQPLAQAREPREQGPLPMTPEKLKSAVCRQVPQLA